MVNASYVDKIRKLDTQIDNLDNNIKQLKGIHILIIT